MSAQRYARVPQDPGDITPQWLTTHLRQSGALSKGSATSVAVEPAKTWNVAKLAHLTIDYDDDAAAPRRLFAKIAKTEEILTDVFPGEFKFYTDAPRAALPLAACYGAYLDQHSGVTCILLEDLSATHVQTLWPLPPALPMCEAAVSALAHIHAHWWSEMVPVPDKIIGDLTSNETKLAAYFQSLLPKFRDDLGDRLAPERFKVIEKALVRLPELKAKRLASGGPITRVHGDAHVWNALYPKDPSRHDCVFIDFEDWRYDHGAADLAYMMALHWYPDRRARYETDLLRIYLGVLHSRVSTNYGWDDLLLDYRLGHLQSIVVPIYQQQAGQTFGSWWSHLERWFLAFDDLDCSELLQ